ncbi:hypothetical protein KDH_28260 [Dictyobacter sp. S3.2.2.5]|uniref:Uncharacterized protein n=1 Tax=Dictyobacter halimunensis TaxID=3026934 RepID=A0ABQ6FSH4_9CHLR|nr:hypothetical protein KDH_28260 [Dictyobacter sp. S3.2.2.5]
MGPRRYPTAFGGRSQEPDQGGVDGVIWERREDVSDDALEIDVEMIGAGQRHGLQACPEGISGGVVQAEQGALLC